MIHSVNYPGSRNRPPPLSADAAGSEHPACRAPKSGVQSCRDSLVLVDESAKDVPSVNFACRRFARVAARHRANEGRCSGAALAGCSARRGVQDALQMSLPISTRGRGTPVERCPPQLRGRVRPRCSNRRLHHRDPFGPEDLVNGPETLPSRSRSKMCFSWRLPVIVRLRACWVTQAESVRLVIPATQTSLDEGVVEMTTRDERTCAATGPSENRSRTAARPPRDTFHRSGRRTARQRSISARLQLRGWDSNPQPTD
jgi:hypothetical protein